MRVLLIGGSGLLGSDLRTELTRRGLEHEAPSSSSLDITDPMQVATIATRFGHFDWCINCAAFTGVDKAETEVRAATELNTLGPGYLAQACSAAGMRLAHLSTDFVFDGTSNTPILEDSPTAPLGVYGQTKLEGEQSVRSGDPNSIVIRTSWLYGPNGNSFPKTMIRLWLGEKKLKVVADQTGCPTYTPDLSKSILDLLTLSPFPGIYHLTGPTVSNWHEFAVHTISAWKALNASSLEIEIEAIPTADYPTPAVRPKYSVLSNEKVKGLGISSMRLMDDAILDFVHSVNLS